MSQETTTTTTTPEPIVLGSGTSYLKEFDADTDLSDFASLVAEVCVPKNKLGSTKNGATLTYTATSYTAKSDLGDVSKTVLQAEDASLALGIITVGPNMLSLIVETSNVNVDEETGLKVLQIGGVGNANGKKYVLVFYHKDAQDGDIAVMIVGKNTAELSFAFSQENETIINPTFTAEPKAIGSREGVLIQIGFYQAGKGNFDTVTEGE